MSCRSCHDAYQPEIDRLRTELANAGRDLHTQLGYNAELNAAIARIRDLCADLPRRRAWEIVSAERLVWDVLHILDGGTE